MSISQKSANVQLFRLMLYRRALHPELFDMQTRKVMRHGEYEVEAWLMAGGHVVRCTVAGSCLTETVMENGDHLPEHGLVHALPCLGEKDYEMEPEGRLGYVTTIQTESLSDNLYMSTYRELREFAKETSALVHEWKDADGSPSLSVIDTQKYKKEFHFQSYHLLGATGVVLRTQSIYEVLN